MGQKHLILNRERNLGDIISDAFTIVKRNFKVIGGLFLILVLPILLVATYNLYFVFSEMDFMNIEESSPFAMFGGFKIIIGYFFMVLAFLIYYYIIFSSALVYQRNENQTPDRSMVLSFMKENAVKYFTYFIAVGALVFLLVGLFAGMAMISPVLMALMFFIFFIGVIYLFPILNIFPLVYLDSDKNFVESIRETFRLIKGEWWPSFGVILVTNIIGSLASYVLIIPVYAIMMIQVMSNVDSGSSGAIDMMGFWMGIMIIVSIIASTIVLIYTASGVVLKYYDLKERKDNTSLYNKIDGIGSGESTLFENEGEF